MKSGISVVINTRNEEGYLARALSSVKGWVDEIVVVDMESTDTSVEIAKKYGAKVIPHKFVPWVEPARNFAVTHAKGPWILVIDPDEEIPPELAQRLRQITKVGKADYVRLPRKNIIFNKWVRSSRWWPDYHIRFFKKGAVTWTDKIHIEPQTSGQGEDIEAKEEFAIIHHHYDSIRKYLFWMDRYADARLERLKDENYVFSWADLIRKPSGEFLSRYFFGEGYKDGIHGLVLAILQAISEFVTYAKAWEAASFPENLPTLSQIDTQVRDMGRQYRYWEADAKLKSDISPVERLRARIIRKISS